MRKFGGCAKCREARKDGRLGKYPICEECFKERIQ